jgi:hypothetical protein
MGRAHANAMATYKGHSTRPSAFQFQYQRERMGRAHTNAMAAYRGHSTRPSAFQVPISERERMARAHANAMAVYRGHSTHKLQALAHVGFVGGIYRNRVLYNTIELYFSSII